MFKKAFVTALVFLVAITAFSATRIINYQGKVTDTGGVALNQSGVNVTVQFFDALTGGSPIGGFIETHLVNIENGIFNLAIGSKTTDGVSQEIFTTGSDVYLSMTINYQEQTPRPKIVHVPYSIGAFGSKIDCADYVGTVDAGNFCIDRNYSTDTVAYTYLAQMSCQQRGMRLCSWEEYSYACILWQDGKLSLLNVLTTEAYKVQHTSERAGATNRGFGHESELNPATCYDDSGAIDKHDRSDWQEAWKYSFHYRCCIKKN